MGPTRGLSAAAAATGTWTPKPRAVRRGAGWAVRSSSSSPPPPPPPPPPWGSSFSNPKMVPSLRRIPIGLKIQARETERERLCSVCFLCLLSLRLKKRGFIVGRNGPQWGVRQLFFKTRGSSPGLRIFYFPLWSTNFTSLDSYCGLWVRSDPNRSFSRRNWLCLPYMYMTGFSCNRGVGKLGMIIILLAYPTADCSVFPWDLRHRGQYSSKHSNSSKHPKIKEESSKLVVVKSWRKISVLSVEKDTEKLIIQRLSRRKRSLNQRSTLHRCMVMILTYLIITFYHSYWLLFRGIWVDFVLAQKLFTLVLMMIISYSYLY